MDMAWLWAFVAPIAMGAIIGIFHLYDLRKQKEKPNPIKKQVDDRVKKLLDSIEDDLQKRKSVPQQTRPHEHEQKLDEIEVTILTDKDYAYMTGNGDSDKLLVGKNSQIILLQEDDGSVPQNNLPYVILHYWMFEDKKKQRSFDLTVESRGASPGRVQQEVDGMWNKTDSWNNTVYPFLKGVGYNKDEFVDEYHKLNKMLSNWKETGRLEVPKEKKQVSQGTGEKADNLPFDLAYIE